MGSLVKGVIIHESLLIQDHATTSFHPPAHSLLRKLSHSNLHIGIYCSPYLLDNKYLKKMAMQHSSDCFPLNDESSIDGVNEITLSWGDIGGEILYLISNSKKDAIGKLSNLGWIIVVFDVEGAGACENSGVVCISKLEEFPLVICGLNRKRLAIGYKAVTVGYIMKPSREEDFSKRGAFPMNPTPNGLMFLPLTFELPLPAQLQLVDLVLVISVDLSGSSELLSSRHAGIAKLVTDAVNWLARKLDLTIFGFDKVAIDWKPKMLNEKVSLRNASLFL
ncbi:hypothetical protein POTOM_028930 [Populus tomentosa]|uniref:Uncharacterized protein n=1 Tax=Populus tomentosa TaxID=118781 RepID=A0A8X7ZE81_POPTO|nr:hypothetical protein POTOM_028930 [Populus tomentosa]